MADTASMALDELLRKAQLSEDVDFVREGVRTLAQALMEVEVTQVRGAGRYERTAERSGERTAERSGERTGHRERRGDTRVGSLQLRVPRVRDGSSLPILWEPRRRAERALVAVVQEASVPGISTRRVDELVQTLGLAGMSTSQVALLCPERDAEVERFRSHPLSGAGYAYVWLDATFLKGRPAGRVVAQAVVIALGLTATTGQREVLGLDVGPVPRTAPAGCVSCGDWSLAGWPACTSSSATPLRASRRPSRASCTAPGGNGAASTSCATPSPSFPRRRRSSSRPPSAPSLPRPRRRWRGHSGVTSPPASGPAIPC